MSAETTEFRPVYHPAGLDAELRVAFEEVRVGRWRAMRELLARTGTQWDLRTARSQVLATAAARTHVVAEWVVEEPGSPDALMMQARVAVERALQAHRQGHGSAEDLAGQARKSAAVAWNAAPADPVPWVCMLALAGTDPEQIVPEHRVKPPEGFLPTGPWGLLGRVYERDPYNREAYHRMLTFVLRSQMGGGPAAAVNFAHWVKSWVPQDSGSPLLVLPLYALVEHYRSKREAGRYDPIGRAQWAREQVAFDVQRAMVGWFERSRIEPRSVLDLNYLAHAAWAGRRFAEAAAVFQAMGPYATRQPWLSVADDPGDEASADREFSKARRQCLSVAGESRAGPRPRR